MDNLVKQAAGLGAVAGMRATVAPSVLSHFLSKNPSKALAASKLSFMQSPTTATITKVLSAAELVSDKLPQTPNRTLLSQTAPRVISGALAGAVLYRANGKDIVTGLVIGAAAALAATYVSFYARQYLDKIPYVKDPLVGALEDGLAIKTGASLMHS